MNLDATAESRLLMRDPFVRFLTILFPFLIALWVEWGPVQSAHQSLPGGVRLAVAAVLFVILLLVQRGHVGRNARGTSASPFV